MKVLCFYHGNCAAGFGAAWVVQKFFSEKHPDAQLQFVSSVYQKTDPLPIAQAFWDKEERCEIYIVDFSFTPEQNIQLCSYADDVIHIDHHKTAIDAMVKFEHVPDNFSKYYDLEHSGAMLTWMYLFNDDIPPPLLRHIEDRDLWKFELPGTREIQANLFSYPYDFKVWDKLMSYQALVHFQDAGVAIERKHFKDINELLPIVTRPMIIGGVEMPVANLPYIHSSDAGHILAVSSVSKCAACYWDAPDGRVFSLRSTDDGPDVSAIAKQYGGGGHAHAAGFKVEPAVAMSFEKVVNVQVAEEEWEPQPTNSWSKFFLDRTIPF